MGPVTEEGELIADGPFPAAEVDAIAAYQRAANYRSVARIYLLPNPLGREPLLT